MKLQNKKKILERAFVTNSAQKPAHQGILNTLLEKTLDVNTEISCPLNANGEPEKLFVQNTLKLTMENSQSIKSPEQIATELVLEKLKQAKINVITEESAMQSILNAGIEVQKMAAHYGTNQNIENSESFNGYGVYVLSVNEENAKTLGLKIASKKYGNSFYINNQPLQEFLQERNFSPYWQSVISQIQNPSNENLLNQILTSDVKGNSTLLKEQSQLSTLCSLNLINYKREQTYLYSVEIPDNDGTNYLFYDKTIGIESANRINDELKKIGSEWKVSRNDTGNSVYFNILSDKVFHSQKQASEFLQKIGYVGMETSSSNYIIFDDREMNINNRVQYMMSENGEVYGFAYNGEIYADKNLMNSNVLAHEYTHLWDNYTKNANPELWERGKNVFKQTNIWNEVVNDPSYQNIKNNEDEILSECHARICGKFAQQVLERIAAENGENEKNAVIDWDSEVNNFIAKEFGFTPELGSENYISDSIKAESLKEFLATPMKDLMAGRGFEKQMEKETLTFEEAQKLYPNIVDLSEEFSNPAPTEKEVLEKLRSMVGGVYATATEGKKIAIYNNREKNEHVIKGDNYKNNNNKTRKINRRLAMNAEKLIHNAEFIEAELPDPKKNKDYLLGMHNYEVPVFVNGHGFMVRLEGEVIKTAPEFSPGNETLKKTLTSGAEKSASNFSSGNETLEKTPTSEAQLDNNELLLKLQAAKVSNLYIVRKQRPLFKVEQNQSNENIKTIKENKNQIKEGKNMENTIKSSELFKELDGWLCGSKEIYKGLIDYAYYRSAAQESGRESVDDFQLLFYNSVASKIVDEIARDGLMKKMESFAEKTLIFDPDNINISRYVVDREDAKELKNYISELKESYETIVSNTRNWESPIESIRKRQNEIIDNGIESLQENGGMSDAVVKNSNSSLEQSSLEDAANLLKNMNFNSENYKELVDVINKIKEMNGNEEIHVPSKEEIKNEEKITGINSESEQVQNQENEIPKVDVKSYVSDQKFTGENPSKAERLRQKLIENGTVKPNEDFILISEKQAEAAGCKIKNEAESVMLLCPPDEMNSDFHDEKYFHISAIDDMKKLEKFYNHPSNEVENDETQDNHKIIYGKTILPDFSVIADGNLLPVKNAVVTGYDKKSKNYLLETDGEKIELPSETFKSLFNDKIEQEKEPIKKETIKVAEGNAIVFEDKERGIKGTELPPFALLTQNGFQSFDNCVVTQYDKNSGTYKLSNGTQSVSVSEETFKEISSKERFEKAKSFDENTKVHDKLLKAQYDDFFKLRDNTAYNFVHNLSVYCRTEAKSPCDALTLGKKVISMMSKDEKHKTQKLLKTLCKDGQSMNDFIVETYHNAVKDVPLNEDYMKKNHPEDIIARPFYDTISQDGLKVDNNPLLVKGEKDYNLKIGDSLKNINISVDSTFGKGKTLIHFDELKVISSSKEGNSITVMDKNKSIIELPRDTVLEEYQNQKNKEIKKEVGTQKRTSMQIER